MAMAGFLKRRLDRSCHLFLKSQGTSCRYLAAVKQLNAANAGLVKLLENSNALVLVDLGQKGGELEPPDVVSLPGANSRHAETHLEDLRT